MPNWCNNSLMIEGAKEDLLEFELYAKGKCVEWKPSKDYPEPANTQRETRDLDFAQFVRPTEEDLSKTYHEYGYDWCIENWGTKWNACYIEVIDDYKDGCLTYIFNTAWSPISQKLLDAMTGAFRKLKFTYKFDEGGCCFVGHNEDDGIIRAWTLPDKEELIKQVVPIYEEHRPISESDGREYSEDDMICDIYCDIIDDFNTGYCYVENDNFVWRVRPDKEPLILKEGSF